MDCSLVFIGLSIIVHEVCQIKAYQIWLRAIIAKGANADHIGVEKIKIPVQKHFETIGVLERSNNHVISSNPDAINNAADLQKAIDKSSATAMAPALSTDFQELAPGNGTHFQRAIENIGTHKQQDVAFVMKALKISEEPEIPTIIDLPPEEPVEESQAPQHAVPRSASQSLYDG